MGEKIVKFEPVKAERIVKGTKTTTCRLYDDKNLSIGDIITLAVRPSVEDDDVRQFGRARIMSVTLKKVGELEPEEHKDFGTLEETLAAYRRYYGDRVDLDTEVKVISFDLLELF